ncbi:5'-3' exoribonuclease [Aphelenchoides bicaudatus]|nr:5'-3' exoribonuclease [Aphelenchoides bicaudatus]
MGIAGLVPWLRRKYPLIAKNVVEDGKNPIESNPNFQEFDNMYIDLNGIIHQCAHPEDKPSPKNEEELFNLIFQHIDRLFAIVRPRKVLYIAIDGVAPRAKMNQQRSRRFQSSKEVAKKREEILTVRKNLELKGIPLPLSKPIEEQFDSNCITPGTPFMVRLANALRYYIRLRMASRPAWKQLMVLLSDANVPGEGEHKIIDFIRRQKSSSTYDKNTAHCICAPDADLIMLGLETHELNFTILRQEFFMNRPRPCELCSKYGHRLEDCQGLLSKDDAAELAAGTANKLVYIFIRLAELRKYLEWELNMPNLTIEYDFERAIDDWVFLCFFVGNDFLPHLPSLEIYENAIDRLVELYKQVVYSTKGWLTDNGDVFVHRVEMIMKELGKVENEIFQSRQERELCIKAKQNEINVDENQPRTTTILPKPSSTIEPVDSNKENLPCAIGVNLTGKKRSLVDADKDELKLKSFKSGNLDSSESEDTIRFWEDGWKDRYYRQKFNVSESDVNFRRNVAWAYTEGLCWVFKYYYQGCASWDWYYPYHYAPFASDFDNISEFKPDWSKPTKPFLPFEQQMAIFPAASRQHVPEGWRNFMTSLESPIYNFYPTEFKIDQNGKKFPGQGVALLPFVDEKLLLETLKSAYHLLSEEEKKRNGVGEEVSFTFKQLFNAP